MVKKVMGFADKVYKKANKRGKVLPSCFNVFVLFFCNVYFNLLYSLQGETEFVPLQSLVKEHVICICSSNSHTHCIR